MPYPHISLCMHACTYGWWWKPSPEGSGRDYPLIPEAPELGWGVVALSPSPSSYLADREACHARGIEPTAEVPDTTRSGWQNKTTRPKGQERSSTDYPVVIVAY